MDQNQRPHSREKKVGSGSAGVHTGQQVNTGSGPVGNGGRPGAHQSSGSRPAGSRPTGSNSKRSGSSGMLPLLTGLLGSTPTSSSSSAPSSSASSAKSSGGGLKKLLLIAVAVIVIIFLLKNCSGGLGGLGGADMMDFSGYSDYSSYYSGNSGTSGSSSGTSSGSSVSLGNVTMPTATGNAVPQGSVSDTQADLNVSTLARQKRVTPVGNGRDVVTIMIYMCGTDLESQYGMATSDLQEMLDATISDKVNVIVETGGCKKWKNNVMSNTKNQIYKVEDQGLRLLEEDVGTAAMTDPANLTTFIQYCMENYKADRYALIFWDHGGGSLTGYGYDEKNPNASSMTLSKIDSALKNAGCTFDWIGFDACLMATLETALVCNNYADYLLGSEETEPGTGWHYSGWLTQLSRNTSIPTVELAQTIIDDFVAASCQASYNAQVTLSVMDLAELQGTVPQAFRDFAVSTNELLQSNNYQQVSNARAGVRQFAQSNKINQVDLVDLALRIGTDESNQLAKALQSCVKYNKSTISRSYGVSIYFPYETTSSVKSAVSSYKSLGIDSEYTKCIQSFASLEYGGQITASASQSSALGSASGSDLLGSLLSAYAGGSTASTSPMDALLGSFMGSSGSASSGMSLDPSMVMDLLGAFSGRSMPAELDWVDTELIADNARAISQSYIDPGRICISTKDGHQVLSLTDEEWNLIQTVELNVFAKDGDGFVDLGLDNTFDWYGDDLLLEYDGTWLTVNGNVCAYYLVSDSQLDDGSWLTIGRIPAMLNGQAVNLQVVFDDNAPDGVITGAYPLYTNGEVNVQAKGEIPVMVGDTIQFLCDYYNTDGSYSASYTLGSPFTVTQAGLQLENLELDADALSVTYRLTDIYGNHFWTPVIN